MSSTEQRAGFRPPWSFGSSPDASEAAPSEAEQPVAVEAEGSDQPETTEATAGPADADDAAPEPAMGTGEAEAVAGADSADVETIDAETTEPESATPVTAEIATMDSEETEMTAEASEPTAETEVVAKATAGNADAGTGDQPRGSAPTRFQQDLARAIRAAAETARTESLERLTADSAARTEAIRTDGVAEATALRQQADDDIAKIREWSKGEIARIRSETDIRISARKSELEDEIEENEAVLEARIAAVADRVTAYEAELDAFFGRLAAEEDPIRIASLAQAMPEGPDLDDLTTPYVPTAFADLDADAPVETTAVAEMTGDAAAEPEAAPWAPIVSTADDYDDGSNADGSSDEGDPDFTASVGRRLAAFGLDPADAAVAEAEVGTPLTATVEAEAPVEGETAHVAATAWASGDEASAPAADEAAVTAPLQASVEDGAEAPSVVETTVVVEGLLSVASIASFKRNLTRFDGVSAVTVTSGPDGEFLFAVKHDPWASVEAGLPAMSGFGVRVLSVEQGRIRVSARDPETSDVSVNSAGPRG